MGQTYYVDSDLGSDSNDGTSATSALKTLAYLTGSAFAGYSDGDVLYLKGSFREQLKIVTPGQGLIVDCFPGGSRWTIRGSTVLSVASSTYTGTPGVFSWTLPPGTVDFADNKTLPEGIASVVVNWDTIVDADGYHSGHLQRAQSSVDVTTRADSWWFEPSGSAGVNQDGGGTIYVNYAEGFSSKAALGLAGLTTEYCIGNKDGIEIGNPTYTDSNFTVGDFTTNNPSGSRGVIVRNGYLQLWCDGGYRKYLDGGFGSPTPGKDLQAVVGSTAVQVSTRSIGYGCRIADGIGCTMENLDGDDCGYHTGMFVGDLCQNNVMQNCVFRGGSLNPKSGNSVGGAFYTGNSGAGSKNITGCRAYNVTLHKYTFLGRSTETVNSKTYAIPIQFPFAADGSSAYTTCGTDGFISHTNAAANNAVLDVAYRGCIVIERGKKSDNSMALGSGFIGGDSGPASLPSDPLDASTYPVRYTNCQLYNAALNQTSGGQSIAYTNCFMDFARAGASSGTTSGVFPSTSGTHAILLDGCGLAFNLDHASAARNALQCSLTSKIYMRNTTIYVYGTGTNAQTIFNFLSGALGSYVFARGCILCMNNVTASQFMLTMGVTPDTTVLNNTNFDMDDCLYAGFTVWCGFPGPNTQAAWKTTWDGGMDPNGVYNGSTIPFAAGSGQTSFDLSAAAKLLRKFLSTHTVSGINGRRYSGNYGAWQYGGVGSRTKRLVRLQPGRMLRF